MNIPSPKYLKLKSRNRLADGRDPQKVVTVYASITAAVAFLVTVIRYFLAKQISTTGGLQNIGTRSILSTADNVLPILQTVLFMCLNLGYLAAILRISRRQYASPKTLKAGAERFWPLLRCKLLQGCLYAAIAFILSYPAMGIFLLTPLSRNFTDAVTPLVASGNFSPEMLLADELLFQRLYRTLTPMIIVYFLLLIPACFLFSYRYRMADYILIDQPQGGALSAMRQSRILMRRNLLNLLKVDLSFWWYYLLRLLATMLLYLDLLIPILGIQVSLPEPVSFFGTVVIYLAADFAIDYFLRNQVEVTYALAYNSIAPKEKNDGVVLGNIFSQQSFPEQ